MTVAVRPRAARSTSRIIEARARLWRRTMPDAQRRIARWARVQRDQLLAAMGVKATDPVREIERILAAVDWAGDTDELVKILTGFHYRQAEGAAAHLDTLGVTVEFGGRGDPAVERILKALAQRPDGPKTVPKRLLVKVRRELEEGLARGLTYSQIGAGGTYIVRGEAVEVLGIRGLYGRLEGWQGTRIARTEAAIGYNRSSAALMRDAGIGHVDITDGVDDAECAEANGSRWTVDYYDDNPVSHPNCTRIGLPVI